MAVARATDTATQPAMSDYPAIFRGYIVRSTNHMASQIEQAGTILPADARDQALHTLSYALKRVLHKSPFLPKPPIFRRGVDNAAKICQSESRNRTESP
jgi:hypothetical protein